MQIDTYTKSVLTVIAISLFLIGINPWVKPPVAHADAEFYLSSISSHVASIQNEVDSISTGLCLNGKLC